MELSSGLRYSQTFTASPQSLLSLLQALNLNLQQAMVLCHFLETNQDKFSLRDKNVIELGAGTGLVTIVSSLLGTDSSNPTIFSKVLEFVHFLRLYCVFRS